MNHNSSIQEQWGFFNKNSDAQLADWFTSHSKLNVVKHSATGQGVISGKGKSRASAQNSAAQLYLLVRNNVITNLKASYPFCRHNIFSYKQDLWGICFYTIEHGQHK